jgi:hypothetical protein
VIGSDSVPIVNVDEVRELAAKNRDEDKLQDYPVSYKVTLVEPPSDQKLKIFLKRSV